MLTGWRTAWGLLPALAGAGLAAFLAAATNGCSNKDAVLGVQRIINPPSGSVSFSADVQPIFTQNCAFPGCHASPLGGPMSLVDGDSYASLVNAASCETSILKRVLPGDSALSYLIIKLKGLQNQVTSCQSCLLPGETITNCGSGMPRSLPPLPDAEIQLISDWIDQGAANN